MESGSKFFLVGVNPGQGMPSRTPLPGKALVGGGPNATQYQKNIGISSDTSLPMPTPAAQPTAQPTGPLVAVIDPNDYVQVTTVTFAFAALGDILAVTRSPTRRAFLSVRNADSSAGIVYIAFDQQASANTSIISLPPGGLIWLDERIPQNDVHLNVSAINTTAVVGYSNTAKTS